MSAIRYPAVSPAGGIEFMSPLRATNLSPEEVIYTDQSGNIVGAVRKCQESPWWDVDIVRQEKREKSPTKYAAFLRVLSSVK